MHNPNTEQPVAKDAKVAQKTRKIPFE
jgi:hypothetical protein